MPQAHRAPAPLGVDPLMLCLALMVCSVGCAFQDVKLAMAPVAQHAPLGGGEGRRVVVVVPFHDKRELERCGMMKNSYNMDTADAVCTGPPGPWIANLLANELRAAGFLVTTETGARSHVDPDVLRIEGDLVTLFVEPIIGFWAVSLETDFQVRLTATSGSGLKAEREVFVKGSKGNVVGAFASVFQGSFDEATRQIVREMVAAILVLMNRYPELGGDLSPQTLRLAVIFGTRG